MTPIPSFLITVANDAVPISKQVIDVPVVAASVPARLKTLELSGENLSRLGFCPWYWNSLAAEHYYVALGTVIIWTRKVQGGRKKKEEREDG